MTVNMEKINKKKGTQSTWLSVQSVNVTFLLFKCQRSINKFNDLYIFILLRKGSFSVVQFQTM